MSATSKRKSSHIDTCLKADVEAMGKGAGFEDVDFVHSALPELDFQKVDTSTPLLGRKLRAPLLIAAITGGCEAAGKINRSLAQAAQENGIALGLGSQRAMLEDLSAAATYKVRDVAPDILLIGNVGMAQLQRYGPQRIALALEAIDADAVAIHLNPLQELLQPEGDKNFEGCLKMIEKVCSEVPAYVIAKETGAGISPETAVRLEAAGVKAIDVAGAGGTSWSGVEILRSGNKGSPFWDWGIPTAVSTALVARAVKIPVICSGGVRSGVDVAKGISLGASLGGAALPFLKAWKSGGTRAVSRLAGQWENELRISMALTGCRSLHELKSARLFVTGKTAEMLCAFSCFPAGFITRGRG